MKRATVFTATILLVAACASDRQPASTTKTPSAPAAATTSTQPPRKVAGAPDFTLKTLDGDTFTLSDHLGEIPIVLNFWAPF